MAKPIPIETYIKQEFGILVRAEDISISELCEIALQACTLLRRLARPDDITRDEHQTILMEVDKFLDS